MEKTTETKKKPGSVRSVLSETGARGWHGRRGHGRGLKPICWGGGKAGGEKKWSQIIPSGHR